jgi:hypothetical protein
MGALDGASSVCRVVAPLLTGYLIQLTGLSTPFFMNSVLCFSGAAALSVLF